MQTRKDKKEYAKRWYRKHIKEKREYDMKYRQKYKERIKVYGKEYRKKHKKGVRIYNKKWKEKNLDKVKKNYEKWRRNNPNYHRSKKRREYDKKWREENHKKIKEYSRKQKEKNPEYYNKYTKNRKKIDPKYHLNCNISTAIYKALKDKKANRHWEDLVGYTLQDLMTRLEFQFDKNMDWNNYGNFWSIDHVKPKSLFHYTCPEDSEFKECWALKNLQPMEKKENIKKNNHWKLILVPIIGKYGATFEVQEAKEDIRKKENK